MNNNVNANNINGFYAVTNTIEYPNYIYNESDISCVTYTIDTTNNITIPEMPSYGHITFSSPYVVSSPGTSISIDNSYFDFNGIIEQPGFLVNLGDEDEVHYSHEEATEALKEHHNEKKLRKEHKMLEKAYKEYKMLARLLQIEEDEESY